MPFTDRLGNDIHRVSLELTATKAAALKEVGVTVPQYTAMYYLAEVPGRSAAELARVCLVTPQTMTVILRNLERTGLIRRQTHERHRNVVEVQLTATGRELVTVADDIIVRIEQRVAESFSVEEHAILCDLLRRTGDTLNSTGAD
jgi:DNA-binding MarR family transcriptional regulator